MSNERADTRQATKMIIWGWAGGRCQYRNCHERLDGINVELQCVVDLKMVCIAHEHQIAWIIRKQRRQDRIAAFTAG